MTDLLWLQIFLSILLILIVWLCYCKYRKINYEPVVERMYCKIKDNFDKDNTIRILSYNIMADNVTFKLIYSYCQWPALNFSYRAPRIIEEIQSSLPDVICLQEVDQYEEYYKNKLQNLGYVTFLNKRFKLFKHGALIGVQIIKYDIIATQNIDFNEASTDPNHKVHAAAVMAIIESKTTKKRILICSIHTYFLGYTRKYLQIAYCLKRIKQFMESTQNRDISFVLAGDFNADRNSSIVQYLDGIKPHENNTLNKTDLNDCLKIWQEFTYDYENWNIQNSYDFYPGHRPIPYTHHMKYHKGIIDFIFFSHSTLQVTRLMEPPYQAALNEGEGTPNKLLSSDHIRIEAEFEFI